MSKRKRLLLKESKDSDADDDAYVWSDESLWGHRRKPRPYPSSNQMIIKLKSTTSSTETAAEKKVLAPILTSFLASIGKLPASGSGKEGEKDEEGADNNNMVASIDDPSRSTLTAGQHKRYLGLLSSRQDWKHNQKKEFRKLSFAIKAEQRVYEEALKEFWGANKDRVLVGFTQPSASSQEAAAAGFAQLAAYPDHVRAPWRDEFNGVQYGKCCQLITLKSPAGPSAGNKNNSRWTVDAIESQAMGTGESSEEEEEKAGLPSVGSRVPLPTQKHTVRFLKHDETAITLAKEHNISILATLEAIEAIMGTENAQWSLPIHFQKDNLAIVDLPLPQPYSSPRACLTRGLDVGLSQWCGRHSKEEMKEPIDDKEQRYRYVLLTLPQPSSDAYSSGRQLKAKQMRVLVRVPNQSTRIHAHVEYFPERGEEITSSYERSLWILDHFLKFERSLVGRIDPSSCQVLKWEETSKAHALAGIDGGIATSISTKQDPMDHWHRLAKLLQAIPTISSNEGNFLLCLPGRDKNVPSPRSASVHMEATSTTPASAGEIDVEAELNRAGEVQLGAPALERTMLDWKWTSERAPFTFPIDTSKSDTQGVYYDKTKSFK